MPTSGASPPQALRWRARVVPALEWAALAGALLLALLRLRELGLSPFINDEVYFLDASRLQAREWRWAFFAPVKGSSGAEYGPAPVWFYGLVQRITGNGSAVLAIGAMCALVTAAQVGMSVAAGRLLAPGRRWAMAAILALTASSPYQYYWARLAWNQLPMVVAFAAVTLLCARQVGPMRAALIGAVMGLGVAAHPMIGPLAIGVTVFVAVAGSRRPLAMLGRVGAFAAAALATSGPYLVALARSGWPHVSTDKPADFAPVRLLELVRPSTTWQIESLFDDEWNAFVASASAGSMALGKIALGLVAALVVSGMAAGGLRASAPGRRLWWFTLAAGVGHLVFYAIKGLPTHPHYQFPIAWIAPLAAASALAVPVGARRWRRMAAGASALALIAVVVLNVVFIAQWMAFVRASAGTRGNHYSTTVGEQQRVVDEACARPAGSVQIEDSSAVHVDNFLYHLRVRPACAGKNVMVCWVNGCPPLTSDTVRIRVTHVDPTGGRLATQMIDSP